MKKKILFVVNDDWFFISHRLPIALEAIKRGYNVHVATSQNDKKDYLQSLGITHHVFFLDKSGSNPFFELKTIFSLCRLFRKINPHIVHNITIKPVIYGTLAARLTRVKYVVNAISGLGVIFLSNSFAGKVKRAFVLKLYKFLLVGHNVDVIVQNPDDLRFISNEIGVIESNSLLIKGSGVDIKSFLPTPLPKTERKVVFIGRMLEDKGVQEFYGAAKKLKPLYPKVEFILAGDTHHNPSSMSEDTLINWSIEGAVNWIGHQSDVKSLIQSAYLVVLPSYREGMPKALLEAAACSRPVITTDVPGCRDAIINNKTGILVPVKDTNALAKAIERLINSYNTCEKLSKEGRILAENEFSLESVVSRHIELYESKTLS